MRVVEEEPHARLPLATDRGPGPGRGGLSVTAGPFVSTVRRFTAEFYERVLVDQEVSEKVALATHELLENAVKWTVAASPTVTTSMTRGSM